MKVYSSFNKVFFFLLLGVTWLNLSNAQDVQKSGSQSSIKTLLDSRNWVFKAETMNPMGGMSRQLTSPYEVQITDSTMISQLPYFGRVYSAPIDLSNPALQFTSTKFDYSVTPGKKGRWNIIIVPKDISDVRQYLFTVFENGKATLQVISNNRQSISFYGTIAGKA